MADRGRWSATAAVVLELVLAAAGVAAACLAFGPYFAGSAWLAVVLGAVLAGTALAVAGALWRWPAWLLAPVGLVGLYLYELLALREWPPAPLATGQDLLSGWDRMLTVALPADPGPEVLALPVAAGFVAAYVVAILVLRTAAVVTLSLPALGVLLLALAITAERGTTQVPVTVGVVACLGLLVLVRANRPDPAAVVSRTVAAEHDRAAELDKAVGSDAVAARRTSAVGRVLLGLPGIAFVIALAAAGALLLPIADGSDRADPRDSHEAEVQVTAGLSPLVELKPQLVGPATKLYTVKVTGEHADRVDRIRLAALEDFDGALWSQAGTFVLAGSQLPHPPTPEAGADTVTLEIAVLTGRSPYLPVVGQPLTLTGTPVAIEEESGSLVRAQTDDASRGAVSYTVTAELARLASADTADLPDAPARLTALPDVPAWVSTQAQAARGEWRTPWTQLEGMQEFFRARPYEVAARPGHSYGAVKRTLVGDTTEAGNAEQYASAFAILGRSLSYPTRVAVGYLLKPEELEGDTYTVTAADVHAWPEVLLEGYGWVAFDPTNTDNPAGPKPPRDPEDPVLPSDDAVAQPAQPDASALDQAAEGPGTLATVARGSAYAIAGLVLLGLLLLAAIVVAKMARRSRRRHHGSPAQRVAAAWRETTDRLRELGIPTPQSWTSIEIAQHALAGGRPVGDDDLLALARLETASVYAPTEPSAAVAQQAWELEQSVHDAIAAGCPLVVRVRAAIDPRPLLDPGGRWVRRTAAPSPPASSEASAPRELDAVGAGRSGES
ncbi:transglutaminaseTgpA domain-containing protein [Cellulomonas humilata]|uniref:Transglutaminase-like putative cysteine protease n=1 Tax=Cellulomonas humilata TaxID=144055 RepID=A0ABU0EG20_9CELL|nr:transglutaminaseTgpA domain-containing protein [Cellulomonas humilata]MDQ0373762.1 transglutaminase-like putative cysteine protease [Cellulomonas humilata]